MRSNKAILREAHEGALTSVGSRTCRRRAAWLLPTMICACLSANAQQPAASPPPHEPQKSAMISGVIRVSDLQSARGLTNVEMTTLLNSTPVLGAAIRDVCGSNDASDGRWLATLGSAFGTPAQNGLFGVTLTVAEPLVPKGAEVLSALTNRLQQAFVSVAENDRNELAAELESARRAEGDALAAYRTASAAVDELLARAGRAELSSAAIDKELTALQSERDALRAARAAQRAREAAIAEQIKRASDRLSVVGEQSDLLRELSKIVDLREREVQRLNQMREKGAVADSEVSAAMERLAQAKAELARAREQVTRSAGGEVLAKLNTDLVELAIASAETEARLKANEDQLADFAGRDLRAAAARYERELKPAMLLAAAEWEAAAKASGEARRALANFRMPSVILVGK